MQANLDHSAAVEVDDPPATYRREATERYPETVIERRPGWKSLKLAELWRYRELLFFLAWRDIQLRYKQSFLGVAWAILQPLMFMIVFTVVFGRMASVPTNGIPYPLFAFAALLPWSFFAGGISRAGSSVVGSASMITKVYLPRLAIPFASVGAALFDFAICCIALAAMILYYSLFPAAGAVAVAPGWSLLWVPPLIMLTLLAALGVGTLLGALSVAYRDFKHIIPFLVQLWMFATPAIYMATDAPPTPTAPRAADTTPSAVSAESMVDNSSESVRGNGTRVGSLLELNPMMGLIASFRAAVLGQPMPWSRLAYSAAVIVVMFLGACMYFNKVEETFADVI